MAFRCQGFSLHCFWPPSKWDLGRDSGQGAGPWGRAGMWDTGRVQDRGGMKSQLQANPLLCSVAGKIRAEGEMLQKQD